MYVRRVSMRFRVHMSATRKRSPSDTADNETVPAQYFPDQPDQYSRATRTVFNSQRRI